MLSYNDYNMLNESVRSELFKNGMCVSYSKTGKKLEYYTYLCLTEKDDIEKALDKLKWSKLFSTSDEEEVRNDKYGVLITSRENGVEYILISEIIVNNIMYIWDTDLKFDDCIKDEYIKDLSDKCTSENLIYEKDVDLKNIVTILPDEPYNSDMKMRDSRGVFGTNGAYDLNHSGGNLGSFKVPISINI